MSVGCVYSIKRATVPTNGFMQPRQAIKIERDWEMMKRILRFIYLFIFFTLFFSPLFFFFFFIVKYYDFNSC